MRTLPRGKRLSAAGIKSAPMMAVLQRWCLLAIRENAATDPECLAALAAIERTKGRRGAPSSFGGLRARNLAFAVAFLVARAGGRRGAVVAACERVSADSGAALVTVKVAYCRYKLIATRLAREQTARIRDDEAFVATMRRAEAHVAAATMRAVKTLAHHLGDDYLARLQARASPDELRRLAAQFDARSRFSEQHDLSERLRAELDIPNRTR